MPGHEEHPVFNQVLIPGAVYITAIEDYIGAFGQVQFTGMVDLKE
jgi:hypothetical protein